MRIEGDVLRQANMGREVDPGRAVFPRALLDGGDQRLADPLPRRIRVNRDIGQMRGGPVETQDRDANGRCPRPGDENDTFGLLRCWLPIAP